MNEIEKINDELRNYKLFKIQRANTRKQEFEEVKYQILKTKKGELFDYFTVFINLIFTSHLFYNLFKSYQDKNFYEVNKLIIFIDLIVVIIASLITSYKLIIYIIRFKAQLISVEKAIQHFSNESEVLKGEYEIFVNNYLHKNSNNH
jgi:hypothetical protein